MTRPSLESNSKSKQNTIRKYNVFMVISLVLFLTAACATAYFYEQLKKAEESLQEKNELLEVQKEKIKRKNEQLKESNKILESIKSNSIRDSLLKEISRLTAASNVKIKKVDLSRYSNAQLEKHIKEIQTLNDKYNTERRTAVKDLNSKDVKVRERARKNVLLEYSQDHKFVEDLIKKMDGNVNKKNADTYYEFLEIISKLDKDVWAPYSKELDMIVQQGNKEGLNSKIPAKTINNIRLNQ